MWPVGIIYIFFAWKTLASMVFGLLSRMINIFGLILINPVLCSIVPLDGGSAISTWRKSLVLNIFYIIYPVINSVSLFGATSGLATFPDLMFRLFFLIAGIQSISSLDKLFEKMLGRDDKSSLVSDGSSTYQSVEEGAKKAWGVASGAAKMVAGGAVAAIGGAAMAAGAGRNAIRALH